MAKPEENDATNNLSPAQEALRKLWEDHVRYEFSTRNTDDTLATMVDDAYVNHIPVLTGGSGRDELREFYSKRFIPQMPPDTEMTPVSRTIGEDQIVDEMVFKFTHTIPMDWMLPGIPPTGKRCGSSASRNRSIQRRQTGSRAHLLGPSIACSFRSDCSILLSCR